MEEIKRCYNCGKPVIDQFVYCPFCGEELEPKCKSCGEPLLEGANFCAKCGASVVKHNDIMHNASASEKGESAYSPLHNAKRSGARHISAKSILALAKSVFVVLVCVLMLAVSFAGVIAIDVKNLTDEILSSISSYTFSIDGDDIELTTIDFMKLMFATARHYDESKDAGKLAKLEGEAELAFSKLMRVLQLDVVSDSRIELSKESLDALHDCVVIAMEYQMSVDSSTSHSSSLPLVITVSTFGAGGGDRAAICTAGAMFFIDIFVCALMLAFAIVELVKVIRAIVKGEAAELVGGLDAFLPMLLVLPLAGVLALSPLGEYVSLAGAMISGIVFSSIAILGVLVLSAFKSVKQHNSINVIIPKIITAALCVVMLGCCFAPVLKATYEGTLGDSELVMHTCSTDLYASTFTGGILTSAEKEYFEQLLKVDRKYTVFTNQVQACISSFQLYTEKDLYMADGAIIDSLSSSTVAYSCMAQLGMTGAGALSVGYFALVVAMLLIGGVLCALIGEKRGAQVLILLFAIIVLIGVLAVGIATMEIVDYQMRTMKTDIFHLSLGGGTISAIVIAIALFVFSLIPIAAFTGKRSREQTSDEVPVQHRLHPRFWREQTLGRLDK